MPDLTGVAGQSLDDLAAPDDAAADPGADERGDHILITAADAQPEFGDTRDADVVSYQHRPAERRAQFRAEREIPHVHVGAEEDRARLQVQRTWRADARACDFGRD